MKQFDVSVEKVTVTDYADVVVIGGGLGGISASIAAARQGMKVILLEKSVCLGGLATQGHVCLYEPLDDGKGNKVSGGLVEELMFKAMEYGYSTLPESWASLIQDKHFVGKVENPSEYPGVKNIPFNRDGRCRTLNNMPALMLALEEMVLAEGVDIRFETTFCEPVMEGQTCVGVIAEDVSGKKGYGAKVVIDATGSCTVLAKAGSAVENYQENKLTYSCYDTSFTHMRKALESGKIIDAVNWRVLGYNPDLLGTDDAGSASRYKGGDAEEENRFLKDAHRIALEFLKKNQRPDYTMLSMPTVAQIRMIRRIKGCSTLTKEHVDQAFEDSVGCISDWRKAGPLYELPYGCLISPDVKNMGAAGRIISTEGDTWDVFRCFPGVITSGEAVGVAAALAVRHDTDLHQIDVSELQEILRGNGVTLHISDVYQK